MNRIVIPFPGSDGFAQRLAAELHAPLGGVTVHRFPDGESSVRIDCEPAGAEAIVVCSLDRPDEKTVPLLFACATLRRLGARRITLVAPYLAYMRQDVQFHPGEAIAAKEYALLLSAWIDRLITVDPHLHRITSLSEIYRVPCFVAHAAPAIAQWIAAHIEHPLLIGPDSESDQWVRVVAAQANAPFVVLQKTRRGDRDVEITIPDIDQHRDRTPVLVDDIISTARTMIATVSHLHTLGLRPPVCIGVHAVFAGTAHADLLAAGVANIVTCDTIAHVTNAISVVREVAGGM